MILLTAISVNLNNREGLIATCRSIRALKERAWFEHIIVDGGSADGSLDQLEKHDLEKTKLIIGQDSGIYDGMNKGIIAARGTFVWMLNSGDEFAGEAECLEHYLRTIERNKIGVALFGAYLRGGDLHANKRHRVNFRKLIYMMSVIHQSILVRKEVHKRFGLYPLKYQLASDYDLISSLARNRSIKVSVSERPLSVFFLGGLTDKRYWRSRIECAHSAGSKHIFISIFTLIFFIGAYLNQRVKKWRKRVSSTQKAAYQ